MNQYFTLLYGSWYRLTFSKFDWFNGELYNMMESSLSLWEQTMDYLCCYCFCFRLRWCWTNVLSGFIFGHLQTGQKMYKHLTLLRMLYLNIEEILFFWSLWKMMMLYSKLCANQITRSVLETFTFVYVPYKLRTYGKIGLHISLYRLSDPVSE